ncbi:hypothetical protein H0H92_007292, partial [Tricholoma furcatifolium]
YQAYFSQHIEAERERVGDPQASRWRDLLSASDELQATGSQSLRERRREFDRLCGKFGKLLGDAHARHFEAFVTLVGSCIHEDTGLGYVKASPGLQELLASRLELTDSDFLAYAKSESFHQKALTATRDWSARRAASAPNTKPEIASATSDGAGTSFDNSAIEGGGLKGPSVDAMRTLCKVALFGLYGDDVFSAEAGHPLVKESKAKGKNKASESTEPSARLPWNTLPQITATSGLRLLSWPWGVDFPGQPGPKAQGIKSLPAEAARLLLAALEGKTSQKPTLHAAEDPDGVRDGAIPVILTVAPPADSPEDYGHVMFADGKVEKCSKRFGVPRKGLVAAYENVAKLPPPPPPPTPPVRVTRSKKKASNVASEKIKPRVVIEVGSSDSDATASDADSAATKAETHPSSAKLPPPVADTQGSKRQLTQRSNSVAPAANKALVNRSVSMNTVGKKLPASRANSTEPTTTAPKRSKSIEPSASKAPSSQLPSTNFDGVCLKVTADDFIPLTIDALSGSGGFAPTPMAASTPSSASKRLGGVTDARAPSPPKKPRLTPILEVSLPPATASATQASSVHAALPAPPSAASLTPVAHVTLPSAVPSAPAAAVPTHVAPPSAVPSAPAAVLHAHVAPPSAVPSAPTAVVPAHEPAFYVPPGMMLDPAYFGGGGFVRFGGDPSSMEGRALPGSFGFQTNAGHYAPIPGAFGVSAQSRGFPAFGGAIQPQGPAAYFFPPNYGPHAPMQHSAPSNHPAPFVAQLPEAESSEGKSQPRE